MNPITLSRAMIFRGVIALLFAAAVLFTPGLTLLSTSILIGAYFIVDGVSNLVSASSSSAFRGILGIVAGIVAIVWPGITVLALTVVVAVWALTTGGAELYSAISRKWAAPGSRAWLAVSGALSIALGAAIIVWPALGVYTLLALMATFAALSGLTLITLGRRLRKSGEPETPNKQDSIGTRRAA